MAEAGTANLREAKLASLAEYLSQNGMTLAELVEMEYADSEGEVLEMLRELKARGYKVKKRYNSGGPATYNIETGTGTFLDIF
ncbi:hypothetical protein [Chromobacterium haemolyticum]|uniref:Uncharacterized protein n=1 Tax=Chromobacterium haemolyticum TaxID=394935 RepID=A0A1W0D2D0_9NEIS|nr:hypothetical protein [Chromobacterium haemolyticum]OQS41012.1 hypothetical protein B0T45_09260 [Chromobacterium haemolyticum]